MDDVNGGVEFPGEPHEEIDRSVLACWRPALEPGRVTPWIAGSAVVQERWHLGMRKQRKTEPREHRKSGAEVLLRNVLELVDARRAEKAFEAEHPGSSERLERVDVAWYHAAPEAHVDVAMTLCGLALRL